MSATATVTSQNHQYNYSPTSSVASASYSASSVWSAASGPSSAATSAASTTHDAFTSAPTVVLPQLSSQNIPGSASYNRPDPRSCHDGVRARPQPTGPPALSTPVPVEQRQHPRRTNRLTERQPATSNAPTLPPVPVLQRQSDRKFNFVENLVDSAAQIVETIWTPPKYMTCSNNPKDAVLPLRVFIQETLRRSRTSYSTLQVALYYLIVIKPHLPGMDCDINGLEPELVQLIRAKQCGRRMFLAALILASKYLQDRNYSARAWSKISGLNTQEINVNEKAFLEAIDWRLHISEVVFQKWTDLVLKYTSAPSASPVSPTRCSPWGDEEQRRREFCDLIACLSPDLREVSFPAPEPARVDTDNASPAHIDIAPATLKRASTPSPLRIRKMHTMPVQVPQLPPRNVEPQLQQLNAFTALHHRANAVENQKPKALETPKPVAPPVTVRRSSIADLLSPAASTETVGSTRKAMSAVAQISGIFDACAQDLHPRAAPPRRSRTEAVTATTRRSSLVNCVSSTSPAPLRTALPYPRQNSYAGPTVMSSPLSGRVLETVTFQPYIGFSPKVSSGLAPSLRTPVNPIASPKSQEAAWTLNLLREATASPATTVGCPTPKSVNRKRSYPNISGSSGSSGVTPRLRGLGGFGSPNLAAAMSPSLDRGGKRVRCGWEMDRFEGVGQQVAQGAR